MPGLRLERPPRWGILALVALFALNIALFSFILLRPSQVPDAEAAAAAQPTTASSASTSPRATAPTNAPDTAASAPAVLAVYGDGYSAGNQQGGLGEAGWPAQVAAGIGARLDLTAAAQAGYASVGVTGLDFPGLIQGAPVADATVTLIVGSRNDVGEDLTVVAANAAVAVQAAQAAAPAAAVVVIGPIWVTADPPADVLAVRDAVRDAVAGAGVTFVDPLADGWFADQTGLVSADGISPNDAGHAYLAGQIAPVVQGALDAASN